MTTCSVRWRSSGGRGEFEYVPADALLDREVHILIEALDVTIPAEVRGIRAQGKPRLRKFEGNNRQKFHLPQLVMALARLPEPAREDTTHEVAFPLRNGSFVMDAMDFDVVEDDGMVATLAPLRVSIRNSDYQIELQDRFRAIAKDLDTIEEIRGEHPQLADAIEVHGDLVAHAVNTTAIREAADAINAIQTEIFGLTNAASASVLEDYAAKPETELEEEITGKEGRLLTRIHVYKERDKSLAALAKKTFKNKNKGRLVCEACGMDPVELYGPDGERCIEAHHKIPIEELQPDSVTRLTDLAMLCASCHRIVHTRRPCLTIEEVQDLLAA